MGRVSEDTPSSEIGSHRGDECLISVEGPDTEPQLLVAYCVRFLMCFISWVFVAGGFQTRCSARFALCCVRLDDVAVFADALSW